MRIMSFGPAGTIGLELGQNWCWRLSLGASVDPHTRVVYFILAGTYTPPDYGLAQVAFNRVALARTAIPVASQVEEVQRVADVVLQGGNPETDQSRLTEAFNMFRNNPRVKGDMLATCVGDAAKVLQAYWQVREWLESGATERRTIETVPDYRIICVP